MKALTKNTKKGCCSNHHHPNSSCCEANQPVQSVEGPGEKEAASTCCSGEASTESDSSSSGEEDDDAESSACCSSTSGDSCSSVNEESESSACCESTKQAAEASSGDTGSEVAQLHATSPETTDHDETFSFKVKGMDCPSCATTIEKALSKFDNLTKVQISYPTEKLLVSANDDFSVADIDKTISNLGFTLESSQQAQDENTYQIEGMDCASCASTIEKHLQSVAGVTDASVNFATGQMKATHDIPTDQVIKEVAKVGYQARLKEDKTEQPKKNLGEVYGIIASGLLIATGFIGRYAGMPDLLGILFFAAAMIISGVKPVKSAYFAVKSRSLDMNVLMSSAAIGAAIIGEWFEGATVVWLFSFGIFLQNKSMEKTRKSIRDLMDIAPQEAWVSTPHGLVKKKVDTISIGEVMVIKPGDKIPLDGSIVTGESSINQAPITGESIPVDKGMDDEVYAGTINESGALEVKVTKLVEDTTLAKIIHLVEEAQEQRAPTQAFIDKFSNIYTPVVFLLALSVIVFPPILGLGGWSEWVYKGLALLVVACPCALVISTPVAIVSAIGNAAKHGVLIKGGNFLESAGAINAIAFDKTGTLTEGKPHVDYVQAIQGTKEELLSIAYTLESYSTHPIAKTIVSYAQDQSIAIKQGENYRNIAGKGVEAVIDGTTYYAGNPKLFREIGALNDTNQYDISTMQNEGKTIIIVGTKDMIAGIISVSDKIRTTTKNALTALPDLNIEQIVMLTGDNEGTAKLISEQTSVNRYFAELMPEDKVDALKELQQEGYQVAMVGDGINDAPALATSDLGISMGTAGTDTAMETADIILMQDNLEKLPYTMRLSKRALRIIKQNIWFSILIKVAALALIFPGFLTLWMAVLSDTGAAVLVILNALRLLRVKE